MTFYSTVHTMLPRVLLQCMYVVRFMHFTYTVYLRLRNMNYPVKALLHLSTSQLLSTLSTQHHSVSCYGNGNIRMPIKYVGPLREIIGQFFD